MRPKTKEEKKVYEWSRSLPPVKEWQKAWSVKTETDHLVYVLKKELICFTCGHRWPNTDNVGLENTKCVCPSCKNKLQVLIYKQAAYHDSKQGMIIDKRWSHEQHGYTTIFQTYKGYQVLRHLYISCYMKKGFAREVTVHEVSQDWISPEGKHTIIAHILNSGFFGSFSNWSFWEGMNVKTNIRKYTINGDIVPRGKYTPLFDKYKDVKVDHLSLVCKFKSIAADYRMEALLKSGYTKLFNSFIDSDRKVSKNDLSFYWPSIKICQRNKYNFDDLQYIWKEYIRDLLDDGKDIRNAYYVCPPDLQAAHQVYINKRQRLLEKKKENDLLAIVDELDAEYQKHIARFKDIVIQTSDFIVRPILNVYDFYKEGQAMHHCIFTGKYYNKKNSLILSARTDTRRIETIEVNLNSFTIAQVHGVCNKSSEYHEVIKDVLKQHMPVIKKAYKRKIKLTA